MGAVTTEAQASLVAFRAVIDEVFMAMTELREKDWVNTPIEIAQADADQVIFAAITNPINATGTQTSGTGTMTAESMAPVWTALKAIEGPLSSVLSALEIKSWSKARNDLPALETVVDTAIAALATSVLTTANTTLQGAQDSDMKALFAANTRIDGLLQNIIRYVKARLNKDWNLVDVILAEISTESGRIDAFSITNVSS